LIPAVAEAAVEMKLSELTEVIFALNVTKIYDLA
jgi:hypothetical protein